MTLVAAQCCCVANAFIKGGEQLKSFKTVNGEAFAEFVEKRSKFLCYAKHVESRNEAENYINSIKSKHWDAKHNVYAYRVRSENISKSSDDGEPQGTAGMPILNRMEKLEIIDSVIVITRYFGGILLGTGGLTRAYSHGAALAIDACGIAEMRPCIVAKITLTYEIFDKTKRIVENFGAVLSDCTYTNFVEARVSIEENKFDNFKEAINELSSGNSEIIVESREFLYIDIKK